MPHTDKRPITTTCTITCASTWTLTWSCA